jgi:hypothetical protein
MRGSPTLEGYGASSQVRLETASAARCAPANVNAMHREPLTFCKGLSGPRGRNIRATPLGGIPGFRECTVTTVVPCLYLRHGIGSVGCRRRQDNQLSSANSAPGSGTHAWARPKASVSPVHRAPVPATVPVVDLRKESHEHRRHRWPRTWSSSIGQPVCWIIDGRA